MERFREYLMKNVVPATYVLKTPWHKFRQLILGGGENQGALTVICNLNGVDIKEKMVQPPVGAAEEESAAEEIEDSEFE
jgi:hypothetical protein